MPRMYKSLQTKKKKDIDMVVVMRRYVLLASALFVLQSHETCSMHVVPQSPSQLMDWITPQNLLTAGALIGTTAAAAFWYKNYYAAPTYVALLTYDGPIMALEQTDALIRKLMFVRDTPWISGVIITMESGGGAPGQSELIYRTVQDIVAVKPVVVLVVDACASGAYLACSPATIVVPAMSTVGCIGVNSTYTKVFPEKFDNEGTQGILEVHPFSAGKYKAIHNPHMPLSDESKEQLQHEVDAIYEAFLRLVAQVRHLDVDQRELWAEGKSFTGLEALTLGLVDYIGGISTAQSVMQYQLEQRAGKPIRNIQFVTFE